MDILYYAFWRLTYVYLHFISLKMTKLVCPFLIIAYFKRVRINIHLFPEYERSCII